ncbi:hypothetical protein ACOSQ3_014037 [Xanthoceras sorbifolium]
MMSAMQALPEGCIAAAISFTSPRDACRLACVSTTFRSAAESDAVWDRFLPPEYLSAICDSGSGASSSPTMSSKKKFYLRACHNPVLINEGKLSFWLDKPSGKKCYMISARELKIVWSDTPAYWGWISLPEASEGQKRTVKLDTVREQQVQALVPWFLRGFNHRLAPMRDDDCGGLPPEKRGDGWWEIELGAVFYGGDEEGDLSMTILEIERGNWKRSLVFQGIEIRPKKE